MSKTSWGVSFADEMLDRGRDADCPRTGNEALYNESCAAPYWPFFFFRRQHLDRRRNPFRDRVSNRVPSGRLILR
jgi:hypothetical protein